MSKQLEYLTIGKAVPKEHFLQHIYNMVYIQLTPEMNYFALFNKLRERLKDDPDGLAAASDWIEANMLGNAGTDNLQQTIAADGEEVDPNDYYAMFDLYDTQPWTAPAPNVDYTVDGRVLTAADIGSKVTYVPTHAERNASHPDCESGTIMHWNDRGVMVDYTRNKCRTDFKDLVWG
jgi:hypothetical protein